MSDEVTPDPRDLPVDSDVDSDAEDVEAHGVEEEDDSEAAQFDINCGCA